MKHRYTWSGRYKALLRDYGFPLFAYYWVTYGTMFVSLDVRIAFWLSFLSSIVVYSVSDWSNLCNLHPRHLYHETYFLLLSKVGTYAAITVGGLDAMDVISRFDQFTGFELANKVDPALGKIGITLVLNEAWEPIRLPFVITTLKPIMDTVNPPKF